jgi:hypothetical protein
MSIKEKHSFLLYLMFLKTKDARRKDGASSKVVAELKGQHMWYTQTDDAEESYLWSIESWPGR